MGRRFKNIVQSTTNVKQTDLRLFGEMTNPLRLVSHWTLLNATTFPSRDYNSHGQSDLSFHTTPGAHPDLVFPCHLNNGADNACLYCPYPVDGAEHTVSVLTLGPLSSGTVGCLRETCQARGCSMTIRQLQLTEGTGKGQWTKEVVRVMINDMLTRKETNEQKRQSYWRIVPRPT